MDSVNSEQMDKACTHALTWFFSIVLLNAKYYCSIFICRNQHNDSWFLIKKSLILFLEDDGLDFYREQMNFTTAEPETEFHSERVTTPYLLYNSFSLPKKKWVLICFVLTFRSAVCFFYVHFISTVLIFHLINIFGIKRRICN